MADWPRGLWLASQSMIKTALQAAVYCRGIRTLWNQIQQLGAPWKEEVFTRFNQSYTETINEPSRVGGGNSSRLEVVEMENSRAQSRAWVPTPSPATYNL